MNEQDRCGTGRTVLRGRIDLSLKLNGVGREVREPARTASAPPSMLCSVHTHNTGHLGGRTESARLDPAVPLSSPSARAVSAASGLALVSGAARGCEDRRTLELQRRHERDAYHDARCEHPWLHRWEVGQGEWREARHGRRQARQARAALRFAAAVGFDGNACA